MNKEVARGICLIGNDLETSEVRCFTCFCTIIKERLNWHKGTKLTSTIVVFGCNFHFISTVKSPIVELLKMTLDFRSWVIGKSKYLFDCSL